MPTPQNGQTFCGVGVLKVKFNLAAVLIKETM